jgi:RING finger protein 113A
MADVEQANDFPAVSFKKRGTKAKANLRKREPTPPPASDSDSGFTSSEDEGGKRIKRRKKNATVTASSAASAPRSSANTTTPATTTAPIQTTRDDATKTEAWYDERDGRNTTQRTKDPTTTAPDGTYKGAANYTSFIQKNPDRLNKPTVGPQKGSSNVRTITVTDFAPDVCKDYKQTGFCGFGDSCKFLHAREAYAQGWQLDREWEINSKGKTPGGKTVASANRESKTGEAKGDDEDEEKLLESIPFACIICRESYKGPVVTKCGHYFCEACALKRYRKDPACAACGTGTGGVFNVAKKLNRLLERKRERAREKGEEGFEEGTEG